MGSHTTALQEEQQQSYGPVAQVTQGLLLYLSALSAHSPFR